ncbi:MAG: lycopene cyclase family protein [Chitinophagaceae bacterium]
MTYDYIIAGSGCAGLSLAMHMIHSGQFKDKNILLVDKESKSKNDRTWCFWETEAGLFESIVYKKWQQAWFHGEKYSGLLQLSPYTYKLIRGIDFYEHCYTILRKHKNFDVVTGNIEEIESNQHEAFVKIDGHKIHGRYIFNSILFEQPVMKKKEYYLLQHFKGFLIETAEPVFNPDEATLMDFRVDQQHGATFVYTMPFSPTKALVEYTLFTNELLQPAQYEEGLRNYIRQFVTVKDYKVKEEEFGVIPMTNYRFPTTRHNIIYIGTAGGQTKASSGYTFRFIQKHSAAIVAQLIKTGEPLPPQAPDEKKFHFYDSVLLNILHHKNHLGKKIFTDLFKKNKPQQVLRFLDNESSIKDELKIISSLPTLPFLKAALKQL